MKMNSATTKDHLINFFKDRSYSHIYSFIYHSNTARREYAYSILARKSKSYIHVKIVKSDLPQIHHGEDDLVYAIFEAKSINLDYSHIKEIDYVLEAMGSRLYSELHNIDSKILFEILDNNIYKSTTKITRVKDSFFYLYKNTFEDLIKNKINNTNLYEIMNDFSLVLSGNIALTNDLLKKYENNYDALSSHEHFKYLKLQYDQIIKGE
jgi:hypothetical protein